MFRKSARQWFGRYAIFPEGDGRMGRGDGARSLENGSGKKPELPSGLQERSA